MLMQKQSIFLYCTIIFFLNRPIKKKMQAIVADFSYALNVFPILPEPHICLESTLGNVFSRYNIISDLGERMYNQQFILSRKSVYM